MSISEMTVGAPSTSSRLPVLTCAVKQLESAIRANLDLVLERFDVTISQVTPTNDTSAPAPTSMIPAPPRPASRRPPPMAVTS